MFGGRTLTRVEFSFAASPFMDGPPLTELTCGRPLAVADKEGRTMRIAVLGLDLGKNSVV
jgi:hypothetical protein